ncbi:MAG: LacI family DNA-binding transcriptional regulator, partial [Gammaproteobacteria bacterium]|nr:LacI family DNA-binding transcriptional regulator [Gammaproteobacteria bacterium]
MTVKKSRGTLSLPTLADVARVAGVSTATVSRYLNGRDALKPATSERVSEAIQSLGYVPHGAARALASRQSFTIGAVFPALNNQIFATAAQSMQEALEPEGYTLLLANSDYNSQREVKQLQSLMRRGVDGVLLVGQQHENALYDLLAQHQIPYLNSWVFEPHSPHPTLGFDNAQGSKELARYLLDLGHRRIGMVAGLQLGNDRARERVRGVREALQEHGLTLGSSQFREAPYTIAGGRTACSELLRASPDITAIICGNDILAMGAIFECQRIGIKVPEDLSITGYDDIDIVADMTPGLTTVHVPAEIIGRREEERGGKKRRGEE